MGKKRGPIHEAPEFLSADPEIVRFAEQYLAIRGTTPRTREAYQRDLEHFVDLEHEDAGERRADAFGASSKPKRMNCEHGRILDHFRHRQPSEAVALGCRTICEDCNLAGRVVQSFKFQPGIE